MAKKNKSKKEIINDIQLQQDADRRRKLVKEIVFPFLVSMKEPIGYTKIFIQAFSALCTGAFDELSKTTTVGDISSRLYERLSEMFTSSDPKQKIEMEKYSSLISLLKDVPIQDLAYAAELPRYVDGYFTKHNDKKSFEMVTPEILNEIMG